MLHAISAAVGQVFMKCSFYSIRFAVKAMIFIAVCISLRNSQEGCLILVLLYIEVAGIDISVMFNDKILAAIAAHIARYKLRISYD